MTPHLVLETIESLYAIATGQLRRGSYARVIDCCPSASVDYQCIENLGGICPYENYTQPLQKCDANACVPFATVSFRWRIFSFHARSSSLVQYSSPLSSTERQRTGSDDSNVNVDGHHRWLTTVIHPLRRRWVFNEIRDIDHSTRVSRPCFFGQVSTEKRIALRRQGCKLCSWSVMETRKRVNPIGLPRTVGVRR